MLSTVSPTHPLYPHHQAAARIQRAFRQWRQRQRDQRLRDMYRVVEREADMHRQLAQLDAKMAHRLALLDAKAKTVGSKLPLTRVDAERIAAVRLQRWWRHELKKRSTVGNAQAEADLQWASARRKRERSNRVVTVPDHPEPAWTERFSQLNSLHYDDRSIAAKAQAHEQHPPDLARIRELRRMYTAQQRIDDRLPDPNGGESVLERTLSTLIQRVKHDLHPAWVQEGHDVDAACARLRDDLHTSACRLSAARTLIQSIQEQIADIQRMTLTESPTTQVESLAENGPSPGPSPMSYRA